MHVGPKKKRTNNLVAGLFIVLPIVERLSDDL
jgi:hypothetical protein